MKELLFSGTGTALITPFDKEGAILWEELEQLVEFQIENGIDAIIACGTTGEASTMTAEERLQTIEFIIQKVHGRVPVIAGTGTNNTKNSVELSLKAKELGADGLLLVTPYYNKTSQKGLVEHYTYIADSVKMPCIVYNVPARTGVNMQPATYQKLSQNPYIVAAKEANGDVSSVARTLALCGDDLAVYSGDDSQTLPIVALGGKGVISVFSNAFPREMHDLTMTTLNGDLATARKLNLEYVELFDSLTLDVNPMPVKECLYRMGKIGTDFCRMPLTTMAEENIQKLISVLKKHDIPVIG